MELRQLEAFLRVAETKNFSRAAEELSLTQPAVTRQVGALESQLRVKLLDRLGRRVELTPAGRVLQRYATEMLRLAAESQQAVADVREGTAGTLAVGASSTVATYLLPSLLRSFREAHPGIELSVYTGVSSRIVEMVQANTVDIAIVMDFQGRRGIDAMALGNYASVVVVDPAHALARKYGSASSRRNGVPIGDLQGSSLILMQRGTSLRRSVDQLLGEARLQLEISMELDNVEAIKKMIEARLGISLLPQIAVQTEVNSGRLVALPLRDTHAAQRRIVAIHRSDKYLTMAMRTFRSFLGEGVVELQGKRKAHRR